LADLGVLRTHSRPYTSTDNPYSEAQFKTLKYRPEFPDRFQNIEQARAFCRTFFRWYNHSHRHSGIGLMTPAAVHRRWAFGSCVREVAGNLVGETGDLEPVLKTLGDRLYRC